MCYLVRNIRPGAAFQFSVVLYLLASFAGCFASPAPIDIGVPELPLTIPIGEGGELSFSSSNVTKTADGDLVHWDTRESAEFQISLPFTDAPPPVVTVTFIGLDKTGREVQLGSVGGHPEFENNRLRLSKDIRIYQPPPREWSVRFLIRVTAVDNNGAKELLEAPLPVRFVGQSQAN